MKYPTNFKITIEDCTIMYQALEKLAKCFPIDPVKVVDKYLDAGNREKFVDVTQAIKLVAYFLNTDLDA